MSFEVDSIGSGEVDYDGFFDLLHLPACDETSFRDKIFSEVVHPRRIERNVVQIFSKPIAHRRGSGDKGSSIEGGLNVEWGGENGIEIGGYLKGEAHDDKGNYAEIEIEQKSDGTGGLSASAGHKE